MEPPRSPVHRVRHRLTESQVSAGLGAVLVVFFIDGFLRDATPVATVGLVVAGFFIVAGLIRIADPSPVGRTQWHAIALSMLGTLLVGFGVGWLGMPSVVAAAAVGLMAGLLPHLTRRVHATVAAPLYVGAFAGMTSPVVLLGPAWLLLAAVITGCLWSVAREAWLGIGGKMGTVAFAGVALTALVAHLSGTGAVHGTATTYGPIESALVVVASLASVAVTHWLAYPRGLGPVLGSALPMVGVAMAALLLRNLYSFPDDAIVAAWFGAGFVGMTAPARMRRRRWMLPLMATVFSLLMLTFQSALAGLGGGLGATAAAAVICVIGVGTFVRRRGAHG